jgi:uncharacterized surface protein with fasciclin (FAS1) repeats
MTRRAFAAVLLAALAGFPSPAADVSCVYDTLASSRDHTVFIVAATEAKQAAALRNEGPFTVFAPTDAAFKKLDDATVKKVATDPDAVKKLVQAHLATGRLPAADLAKLAGKEIRTLGGAPLRIENGKDGLRVGGARVVASYECSNGVIHVLDAVVPEGKE